MSPRARNLHVAVVFIAAHGDRGKGILADVDISRRDAGDPCVRRSVLDDQLVKAGRAELVRLVGAKNDVVARFDRLDDARAAADGQAEEAVVHHICKRIVGKQVFGQHAHGGGRADEPLIYVVDRLVEGEFEGVIPFLFGAEGGLFTLRSALRILQRHARFGVDAAQIFAEAVLRGGGRDHVFDGPDPIVGGDGLAVMPLRVFVQSNGQRHPVVRERPALGGAGRHLALLVDVHEFVVDLIDGEVVTGHRVRARIRIQRSPIGADREDDRIAAGCRPAPPQTGRRVSPALPETAAR